MRIWFWIHCFTTKCSQFKRRNRWSRGCFWINSQHRCSKWFHEIVTKNSVSLMVRLSVQNLGNYADWLMKNAWLPAGLSRSIENFLVAINIENINPFIASCHPIFGSEWCYLEFKHLYIGACSYNSCHVMILPLKINFKPWICIIESRWPGRSGRGNSLIWNPVEKSRHGIKSLSVFNQCKKVVYTGFHRQ